MLDLSEQQLLNCNPYGEGAAPGSSSLSPSTVALILGAHPHPEIAVVGLRMDRNRSSSGSYCTLSLLSGLSIGFWAAADCNRGGQAIAAWNWVYNNKGLGSEKEVHPFHLKSFDASHIVIHVCPLWR